MANADIIVYTAIMGGKDGFRETIPGPYETVLFTDRPVKTSHTRVIQVPPASDPHRACRIYKMLPHIHLPNAEYTVWVDGAVEMRRLDLPEFVARHLAQANLAAYRHVVRKSCYEEAEECIRLKLDSEATIRLQTQRYKSDGLPADMGLAECGVLLRRNKALDVIRFNETWFTEFSSGSRRDQISFPYSVWKSGVKFAYIEDFIRRGWKDAPGGFFAHGHAR